MFVLQTRSEWKEEGLLSKRIGLVGCSVHGPTELAQEIASLDSQAPSLLFHFCFALYCMTILLTVGPPQEQLLLWEWVATTHDI